MTDVSRRGILAGALGLAGAAIAGEVLRPTAAAAEDLSGQAAEVLIATTGATSTVEDLNLHMWDRVVRPLGKSEGTTLKLTSGKLPTGLSLNGRYVLGRLTTTERYSFELEINDGGAKSRKIFAGTIAPMKQDLSISISLDKSTDLKVTAKELDRIALIGANAILVIFCYIPDATSSTFTSVSDDRINKAFALAKERNVRITMVKPHIVTEKDGDGFYRGDYKPKSIDNFFKNWEAQLLYFTQLCKSKGVEYLSLTCEQRWQTEAEHYNRWVPIIVKLRAMHPGLKLTAAFTTLELYLIYTYWLPQGTPHMVQTLDILGVNSWVRLTNKT